MLDDERFKTSLVMIDVLFKGPSSREVTHFEKKLRTR